MKNELNVRMCSSCKTLPANSYNTYCKKCACDRQKKYLKAGNYRPNKVYKEKVRKMVLDAKNKPCADCMVIYPYYVMDLDHVRGSKKFNLSQATSHRRALTSVQEEIQKCDAVCSNCHRERTYCRTGLH